MQNSLDKISSLANIADSKKNLAKGVGSGDFSKVLENTISEVNHAQQTGDKAMADIATGEVKDLHQAAIAIDKAEISMKLMLEVRNKALSAYKEIARTQL
ncbi:MAG: flagellar hook-basal body complex protein FliE [Sulfurospirillaceae bacterium]|nr:flagellar hook-basal body complex protein FliE [Sulfurospirillaceae bacterium]